MNEVVWSTTAQIIASAAAVANLRQPWPDTASGLAFLVCSRTGSELPSFMHEPLRATTPLSLRRTPELAAYGLAAGLADAVLEADWIEALDHLMGREIFPADRQSFIFDPVEVLGIANGIASFACTDRQRGWFVETLQRALSEKHLVAEISRLAVHAALGFLSGRAAAQGEIEALDFAELQTSELLLVMSIELVHQLLSPSDEVSLKKTILTRFLKGGVRLGDIAEAVTASIVAHRMSDLSIVSEPHDPVEVVVSHCRRFPLFARQMGARQRNRTPFTVQDEYDVQDLLHAILRLSFDDVRPEENTPSYASNGSRLDFFLPRERVVVEAKMTRKGLGQKKVVDELLIDCARYGQMSSVDHLVCVIYDPGGECKNPVAIENDIERSGSRLKVRVVVCPRGL